MQEQVLSPVTVQERQELFRVLTIEKAGPDGIVTVGDILTTDPRTYRNKRGYRSLRVRRVGGVPHIWDANNWDLERLKEHEIRRTLHRCLCEEHHKGKCGPHPLQRWIVVHDQEFMKWQLEFSGSFILGARVTANVLRKWQAASPGTFTRFMSGEDYF